MFTEFLCEEKFSKLVPTSDEKVSKLITIQEGCHKFCSFCVVPYTRGAEFSRPVEHIFAEVKDLVIKGAKEVVLLGQNVSSYKSSILDNGILCEYILFAIFASGLNNLSPKKP